MLENPVVIPSLVLFVVVIFLIVAIFAFIKLSGYNSGFKDFLDYLEETDNANKWIYTKYVNDNDEEMELDQIPINTDLDDDKEFFDETKQEVKKTEKESGLVLEKDLRKEVNRLNQTDINLNKNYQRLRNRIIKLERQMDAIMKNLKRHNIK